MMTGGHGTMNCSSSVNFTCGSIASEETDNGLLGLELEERDETKEVQKKAHRETVNVVRWRNAVMVALVSTAVAVVISTFLFLRREETKLFDTAVSSVCRTRNNT